MPTDLQQPALALAPEIPISLSDAQLPIGWGPWDLPTGWQFESHSGPGGTPALRLTRTDATEYLNARLPFKLPTGKRYRLTASIQVAEDPAPPPSGHAGVEFFDSDNRYLGGGYLPPVLSPSGWVTGDAEFTVPEFTTECRLMFYIRAGVTGTVRFAAPSIASAPFRWTAYPLTPVRDELPAEGGTIECAFFSQGEWPVGVDLLSLHGRVEIFPSGGPVSSQEVNIQNDRCSMDVGKLPMGPALWKFTLLDGTGRSVGEHSLPITVIDRETRQQRALMGCTMDRRGRVRIQDRPFLPIGLYMGMVERDELDEIAGTAFNCLLPYGSCVLKFADSALQGVAAAREVFDACEARGIKLIFCLAGVYDELAGAPTTGLGVTTDLEIVKTAIREFGTHPALLAWYINDEQPVERMPLLMERRRLIRQLDPLHPIYAVMCQIAELPFFSEMVDVYGIDPYPIVDPACNHIRISRYAHDMVGKAVQGEQGIPLWTVIQAHNIGAYDPKAKQDPAFYREAFRDPTFDEILALALLAALRGAKGFLFYSYPDLVTPDFDAGARGKRWAHVRRVAQTLRDLEGFLLSDHDVVPPQTKVLEGEVEVRSFSDDQGNENTLVVGIGPGVCRAEIRFDSFHPRRSQFGRTIAARPGCYIFEGMDACADILVRKP